MASLGRLPLLNLLVAYPYAKPKMLDCLSSIQKEGQSQIIIDSGAFTAWKANKPIHIDDYCKFIESLPFKPFRYFALDVIGDPKGTLENYEIMLKRGFNPVPVFTRGEDPSVLDDYYKTSDVVAIGGLVGTYKNKGYVKYLMKHINERRVHLLGFTDINYVKIFKPYSCDSSTLEMSARFAMLSLFDEKRAVWMKANKSDFIKQPPDCMMDVIKSYGINPRDLAQNANWNGGLSLSRRMNFRSHVRASLAYKRNLNVMYFLALTTELAVNLANEEYKKEISP